MIIMKQNEGTAAYRNVYFFCADDDSADAYAPKTGLTFAAGELKIAKNKTAAFNAANVATVLEIGNGWYCYEFTSGELDTLGSLLFYTNKTDVYADAVVVKVVAVNMNDVNAMGMGYLDAVVSTRLPTATYENLDSMLDRTSSVETGLSLRGLFRLLGAVLAGKRTGTGTGIETFRNSVADTKARLTATVDASGNRTAITTDLT